MRLIDADLVIERLGHDMQEMDDPIFMMMVAATISDIRHAPTIDAVPVDFIKSEIDRMRLEIQIAMNEGDFESSERWIIGKKALDSVITKYLTEKEEE